jgi:hypothetical protein
MTWNFLVFFLLYVTHNVGLNVEDNIKIDLKEIGCGLHPTGLG